MLNSLRMFRSHTDFRILCLILIRCAVLCWKWANVSLNQTWFHYFCLKRLSMICSLNQTWFQYSWPTFQQRGKRKSEPPHGFRITKGSTHLAATRDFVRFALNDPRAKDLLDWISDVRVPDEFFFQTLNHNPQFDIPGSYIGLILFLSEIR